MKKNVSISRRCEYSDRVELLCLGGKDLSAEDKEEARLHYQTCASCQQQFLKLQKFYAILDHEVEKPVTNKALDLAKRVHSEEVEYGLVVCEPIERAQTPDEATRYKTKVVFCANGHFYGDHPRLADYNLQELPKGRVAIRAMTDKMQNKLLLYLWRDGEENFAGWELELPGEAERTRFSPSGAASIALRDIKELGNKVIYFEEKHSDSASGNRFDRMMVSLFQDI
jgi:hypothetical protein